MGVSIDGLAPHRYTPGTTGAKGLPQRQYARVHRMARAKSVEALEVQIRLMLDKHQPGSVRLAASEAVLNRAWGKPKEQVELHNENGVPMLTLRFVDPSGAVADETVTLLTPESGPAGAPAEQEFALTFRRGK